MNSLIARKVTALAGAVDGLRDRLRVVLADELSRAVAETVRDVLALLIGGRSLPVWEPPFSGETWKLPPGADDWDDPRPVPSSFERFDHPCEADIPETPPVFPDPGPGTALPPATLSLAVAAGHWLGRQSGSRACGLAGTCLIGLAAAFGGPVTRSVLSVAALITQMAGLPSLPDLSE
jgi:hypothetical protein